MVFFKRKKQLESQSQALSTSFQNVSNDVYNIFRWLAYLNDRMARIEAQQNQLPTSREEIKQLIDQHYSYDNFHNKIEELNDKVESLKSKQDSVPTEIESMRLRLQNTATLDDINAIKSQLNSPETVPKEPKIIVPELKEISNRLKNLESTKQRDVREKFVQRLTKNSKDYVKNVIINLIQKYQKIPALKLKEMVVDEQGLCSKSSFYRILNEIEFNDDIDVVKQAKEKQYFYKVLQNKV